MAGQDKPQLLTGLLKSVMIDAKTYKNFDLGKLNFDLSAQLTDGMFVVKKDIQEHIQGQVEITDAKSFAPLKDSTVKKKASSKDPRIRANANRILFETNNLWKNQKIKKATKTTQRAEMTIGSTREDIGVYLQEGRDDMAARPFFGISPKVEPKVERLIVLQIDRILRDS